MAAAWADIVGQSRIQGVFERALALGIVPTVVGQAPYLVASILHGYSQAGLSAGELGFGKLDATKEPCAMSSDLKVRLLISHPVCSKMVV
jgi:hypothetical protein